MGLVDHARAELGRAGLFDPDSDYGGDLGRNVLALIETFAAQGHSGASASRALDLFGRLARFEALTPLTADPAEWQDVSYAGGGEPLWQSRRAPSVFSRDGGKTYYDIDVAADARLATLPPPSGDS